MGTNTGTMHGKIVEYILSEQDAIAINRRYEDASSSLQQHRDNANGVQIHVGNRVRALESYPMVIIRDWGQQFETHLVNGKVLLDGSDDYWATSVKHGEGERTWREYV